MAFLRWPFRNRETSLALERLDELASELRQGREDESHRRRVQLVVAVILCAVTSISSFLLFSHPRTSPKIGSPGVIAIAESGPGNMPIDVSVRFDGTDFGSTSVVIAITSGTISEDSAVDLILIVCGAFAEGLELVDVNNGPLSLDPISGASGNADSTLGNYSECSYAMIKAFKFQVVLAGVSPHPVAEVVNDRILYALPGVTTTLRSAPLGDLDVTPWPTGTTLNVRMLPAPADLSLDAAIPSLQDGGLSWDYLSQQDSKQPPKEYRISGVLLDRQNTSQNRIFFAGTLAGVAGAALIWIFELGLGLSLRSRPRRAQRKATH